jgi:hypothetical protein
MESRQQAGIQRRACHPQMGYRYMLFPEPQAEQPVTRPSPFQLGIQADSGKNAYVPERRSEQRANLIAAVLVVPMEGGVPDTSRAFLAISKDASNKGIGLIARHFLFVPEVLICLWRDGEPKLLRAEVRHRKELSRGWVRFGVEVTRTVEKTECLELRRFVALLLP